MPPKKQEVLKSAREPCILKIGRGNNVVQWMEEMQNDAGALYGMTGMFFSTDVSHFIPYPREVDYNPSAPPPGADDVDTDDKAEGEMKRWTLYPQSYLWCIHPHSSRN